MDSMPPLKVPSFLQATSKQEEKKEEGKKFDGDKIRFELLPIYALSETSKVLTFGAKKYGDWNWAQGISYSRLEGATLRHLVAFMDGEDLDAESGLPHLAHAICELMFLLDMTRNGKQKFDDRRKTKK